VLVIKNIYKHLSLLFSMVKDDSKSKVNHYLNKLSFVYGLFGKKNLSVSLDRLKNEESTEQELIYFKNGGYETKGIFVFGFSFFLKELENQEFKKMLGQNSLNFKIYKAYSDLKIVCDLKKDKKNSCSNVHVNDILEKISFGNGKSVDRAKVLRRILLLSYYLDWNLVKDEESFDNDYHIQIQNFGFLNKMKQRFNLDIFLPIMEDDSSIMFVNSKGDLNFVFIDRGSFTRDDVEKIVLKKFKKEFKIGEIFCCEN
jgi:hypothetical protein